MYYYIDGYNLLFHFLSPQKNLKALRGEVVLYLQKRFFTLHLQGMVVFDGAHKRDEESGLSYPSPLIVAYSPKGQTADEYILEEVSRTKRPQNCTVVTNDRTLILHAKSLGAHALSNAALIQRLRKKKKRGVLKEPQETEHQIERLSKIFEERMKEDLD